MKKIFYLLLATSTLAVAQPLVSIQTVTVGDAGNASDVTGFGSVPYEFLIGKYEVTINQYSVFLNAVAAVDPESYVASLWNPAMETDLNVAGISRSGSGIVADPFNYQVIGSGNKPIAYVNWFDAARFVNWVNNGATVGASTEDGAYTLNGATSGLVLKNANATWYLPSSDEWYKAAYYSPALNGGTGGYYLNPAMSDDTMGNTIGSEANQANLVADGKYSVTQLPTRDPNQNYLVDVGSYTGSASYYGTFDQGGSLYEWNDAVLQDSLSNVVRGALGGAWDNYSPSASAEQGGEQPFKDYPFIGFRVAAVPEPSTYALLILGGALWFLKRLGNSKS